MSPTRSPMRSTGCVARPSRWRCPASAPSARRSRIRSGPASPPRRTQLRCRREIDRICQRIGVAADPRKFMPHVTLARLQEHQPDRRRALSFGARQFLHRAVPGRPLRADVVARFGRRRALYRRGGLAAGRRRCRASRAWRPAPPTPRGSCGRRHGARETDQSSHRAGAGRRCRAGRLPATGCRSRGPSPSRISARRSPS